MQYKGLQRASALDLTDDVLGQLIIEAQVRGMSVGHLVSALIRAAMERARAFVRCSMLELQADLDLWIREYNEQRTHQGRWCFRKTPMQTFLNAMPMAKEKMIAA